MYRAIILPPAGQDIREATAWYNAKQKGPGKRFTAQVREKVLSIRQNPKAAAIRYDEVRTAVLDVFPFMVHYSVDEELQTVVVSAVFHTYRDPEGVGKEVGGAHLPRCFPHQDKAAGVPCNEKKTGHMAGAFHFS